MPNTGRTSEKPIRSALRSSSKPKRRRGSAVSFAGTQMSSGREEPPGTPPLRGASQAAGGSQRAVSPIAPGSALSQRSIGSVAKGPIDEHVARSQSPGTPKKRSRRGSANSMSFSVLAGFRPGTADSEGSELAGALHSRKKRARKGHRRQSAKTRKLMDDAEHQNMLRRELEQHKRNAERERRKRQRQNVLEGRQPATWLTEE